MSEYRTRSSIRPATAGEFQPRLGKICANGHAGHGPHATPPKPVGCATKRQCGGPQLNTEHTSHEPSACELNLGDCRESSVQRRATSSPLIEGPSCRRPDPGPSSEPPPGPHRCAHVELGRGLSGMNRELAPLSVRPPKRKTSPKAALCPQPARPAEVHAARWAHRRADSDRSQGAERDHPRRGQVTRTARTTRARMVAGRLLHLGRQLNRECHRRCDRNRALFGRPLRHFDSLLHQPPPARSCPETNPTGSGLQRHGPRCCRLSDPRLEAFRHGIRVDPSLITGGHSWSAGESQREHPCRAHRYADTLTSNRAGTVAEPTGLER